MSKKKRRKRETTSSVLKQVRWPGIKRALVTAGLTLALTVFFSACFAGYGYLMTHLIL